MFSPREADLTLGGLGLVCHGLLSTRARLAGGGGASLGAGGAVAPHLEFTNLGLKNSLSYEDGEKPDMNRTSHPFVSRWRSMLQ
jgi:hypothetical protein